MQDLPSRRWLLIAALISFRVLNGLAVVTYFNPDEYWQSLEVGLGLGRIVALYYYPSTLQQFH